MVSCRDKSTIMENETQTGTIRPRSEEHINAQKQRARIAYGLLWVCASIAMFIAVAFMLLLTDVNPKEPYFYIPVGAFVAITAFVIPLTVKITRHYSK